jgi:5-deoxy-glucuronate isomerase
MPKGTGFQSIIEPHNCDTLEYLRLGMISLERGQSWSGRTEDFEAALVVLEGSAHIRAGGQIWRSVGTRKDVFKGKASSVYVPIFSEYEVEAVDGDVRLVVAGVKADVKYEPFLIAPDDVVVNHRGRDTWQREVHDIIGDNGDGRVQRIVIGETYGEPGAWSSYPSHKHDEVRDQETQMEEVYFFQMNPKNGFAIQLLYTEDGAIDEAHIVRHGDSFPIHKGYHPVVSAGGYQAYYLWFMGGAHGRTLKPYTEMQHRWLDQAK